jgi:hypothetical protein
MESLQVKLILKIHLELRALSACVNGPDHVADNLPAFNTEVKSELSYTSAQP